MSNRTIKTCSIPGCDKPIKSVKNGWCNTHYRRWLKHGDPNYLRVLNTEQPCAVDGCDNRRVAHDWCDMHYRRWKKHGDPTKVLEVHFATREESFAHRTQRVGDCLIWTGANVPAGYGIITVNNKNVYVHRWVWEKYNGPIPDGMQIDHLCHNTSCCEINHLRMVTHKQNQEHRQGPQSNGTSGHRGVHWDSEKKLWCVSVKHHSKVIFGGRYDDIEEAAEAARQLRLKLYTHSDVDKRKQTEVNSHESDNVTMGTCGKTF